MVFIKAIACVDEKMGIGKNGDLLIHIKEDMKFFKDITMGKTVIMGRKTYLSLPAALKGRRNIVLTHQQINDSDIIVCNNFNELLNIDDAFVIGGGEIYKLFLPYCDEIFLTEVKRNFDADTFFPSFDKSLYSVEIILENDLFTIKKYTKKTVGNT